MTLRQRQAIALREERTRVFKNRNAVARKFSNGVVASLGSIRDACAQISRDAQNAIRSYEDL